MNNNGIKNEINFDLNKTENQNQNQSLILTKKFKNTGVLTINQIYLSAKDDYEKLKLIESEYIKLQSDFYEIKKDFINFIEKDEWSEVILRLAEVIEISKKLKENNIKYKTKALDHSAWVKLSVKAENLEKFWEMVNNIINKAVIY